MMGTGTFFARTGPYILSTALLFLLQVARARRLSSFHDIEIRLFISLVIATTLVWGTISAVRMALSRSTGRGEGRAATPAGALRSFFEQKGLYLFLISFFFFTQLSWARTHGHFADLEIRLFSAFLAGTLLARGLQTLLRATSSGPSSFAAASRKLSLSLSPGILFLFASVDISFLVLTPLLCMAAAAAVDIRARRGQRTGTAGSLFPLLLATLLALGLFLRVWGIDYPRDHPDGGKQVTAAMRFVYGDYTFALGHPSDDVSGYPYYAMHIVELSYRACDAALRHLYPHHDPPRAAKSKGAVIFKTFLRSLARWLNVLYQLLSIVLLYLVGRRLFGGLAGIFAAGLMTFSTLQIQMTHVVNADIPSAFFVLASMYLAIRVRDEETPLGYLAAGVTAGAAAAAKYHGIFALFFLFLVFLEWRWRKGDWREFPWRSALTALWAPLGFALAFLLSTPSLLLNAGGTLTAIADYRGDMSGYNVPAEYVHRRAALFFHQLPNHANSFLRFFEPLPGWAALASLLLFWFRRGRRDALLWVYPLVLFPLGNFAHNTSVSYHYLGILVPFYWIAGYAAAEVFGALKPAALRAAVALAFFTFLFLGAASDASMFSLPPARVLAEEWLEDAGDSGPFKLVKSKDEDRRPRVLGIAFGGSSALVERPVPFSSEPVARFDLERRSPTLNNCRNRPTAVHWEDDRGRSLDLIPHPRRTVEEPAALLFPENLAPSRHPGLFRLNPGIPFIRRIRFTGPSPWLIYAHHSPNVPGGGPATLEVNIPGRTRRYTVKEDADLLEPLELGRPDLLYNRLFATVKIAGDRPLAVWLVSPQERGWFYLMTERWRKLEEWERGKEDRPSRLRRAVALNRLGEKGAGDPGLLEEVETALEGLRNDGTTSIFQDPSPSFPLYRFAVLGDGEKVHWPELRPGSVLYGPYATLFPGFYRAVFTVTGPAGGTAVEYRITSETGRNLLALREKELPEGESETEIPFRVTPGSPGWMAEFILENRGGEATRVEGVRVENDVEGLLDWWAREVQAALGDGQ
jgi:hypothetical protein